MMVSRDATHLCPPEDIFHSCVPKLCPLCSNISPGWDRWAADARSPWTQTLSGSTDPAQLENRTLTWGKTAGFVSGRTIQCREHSGSARSEKTHVRTNTSIPDQHRTGFAGTFEAAKCVETISVLTDPLQGTLVDVFKCRKQSVKKVNFIYCIKNIYIYNKWQKTSDKFLALICLHYQLMLPWQWVLLNLL